MTIDMTNNRVSYGLLTDEEKAALHEHEKSGGEFLHTCDGETDWEALSAPNWCENMVYRTVPLPEKTQDVIAWDRLPDWAEWVSLDMDGSVWCYGDGGALHRRIDDFPGIVQIGTCDWKDSRQRRPQVRK